MTETSAKILCDSVTPAGHRLTTFEGVYPRIVLAEVNTHRVFTRSSASSRAIPVEKMIRRALEEPYVPTHWGKNQKGMQADEDVDPDTARAAVETWLRIRDGVVEGVKDLLGLGIHKQIANRWLEPAQWHPTLITATEWGNFFSEAIRYTTSDREPVTLEQKWSLLSFRGKGVNFFFTPLNQLHSLKPVTTKQQTKWTIF